jgi:hypothetical protein
MDDSRDNKAAWKLPFREGPDAPANTRALVAAQAAIEGARGGVEGVDDEALETAFQRATAMRQAAPDDLFGALADDQTPSSNAGGLSGLFERFASALGLNGDVLTADERAESRTETSNPTTNMDSDTRQEKIDEITANSALTPESLNDACDERVELIHSDVTSNTNDGGDGGGSGDGANDGADPDADATADGGDTDDQLTPDDVRSIVREEVEQATANAETDQLAQRIVANSAEYDDVEDVREDYPTEEALRVKAEQVDNGTGLSGRSATTQTIGAPTAANTDDDATPEVSSGKLTSNE